MNHEEIKRSQLTWVFLVQQSHYSREMALLFEGKDLPKHDALVELDPFMKDNLLRIGGQLENSSLDCDEMHSFFIEIYFIYIFISF